VKCGAARLVEARASGTADVVKEAIECASCRATYDVIWGTPFLGHYEASDVLGLFEIASNAREDNLYASRQDAERIERLLRRYEETDDKEAFTSACPDDFVRAPWFQNRYIEYLGFKTIAEGVRFSGRAVLDVGAGSGYDTCRLVQLGAQVTALEYNPMLIRRGLGVAPEARWIGGFAHVLPFENDTFDVVCCNAALHHMRDVPAAMHEMLRVLKPDGWLLTSGDPFRADHGNDDVELDVFDEHPAVLLGVNESVPTFGRLVETLVAHESRLDVELHTLALFGIRGRVAQLMARLLRKRSWRLNERRRLANARGSLAMKVRVTRRLNLHARTQAATVLRAGDYADVLSNYDAAVASLVPLLPTAFVDRPFPGDRQAKFELLNGWQRPRSERDYRTGYRRARWFLTRPEDADMLRFAVKGPRSQADASLLVQIDGSQAAAVALRPDGWLDVEVSVARVAPRERFVCELRVVLREAADDAPFDDYRFEVKGRQFVAQAKPVREAGRPEVASS